MFKSNRKQIYLALAVIAALAVPGKAAASAVTEEALAHLQLANRLVHSGKHEQAIAEYQAAYGLSPNGQIGLYSRKALAAYGVNPDAAANSQASSEIQRQSNEAKLQAFQHTNDQIKNTERTAKSQIDRIESEKTAAVNDVIANPSIQYSVVPTYGYGLYRTPFGFRRYAPAAVVSTIDPVATQARIDGVNNRAQQLEKTVKEDAADKAERLKESAQERARLIDESASNLQTQMSGKGVKLNPTGTNLYIRSYR